MTRDTADDFKFFDLHDSVALVTGASSGLGRHFAITLAGAGCAVGIAGRREKLLSEVANEISKFGGRAIPLPMDVTKMRTVEEQIEKLETAYGIPNILVNNAGIASYHGFLESPEDETANVFSVNQTAVWNMAQAFSQKLVESRKGGSIVNIASIAGLGTIKGAASYAVSKAAVVQLTRILALELAQHNIRANAIAPGYFKTDMNRGFLESPAGEKLKIRIPLGRTGSLEELNGLLLLLASSKSSFITGAIIPIDGGHLATNL